MMASPTLAFCETAHQAEELSSPKWKSEIDIYIATTPGAAWALDQRSISFFAPEDFYLESDLCAHSQPFADKQVEWIAWVDRYIQEAVPDFAKLNFQPAMQYMFFLKIMLDHLFMHAFALRHILDSCQPARIVCFVGEPLSLTETAPFLHLDAPSYTTALVPMAGKREISLELLTISKEYRSDWRGSISSRFVDSIHYVTNIVRSSKKKMGLLCANDTSKMPRIVLYDGYDITGMIQEASRLGVPWENWDNLAERIKARAQNVAQPDSAMSALWADFVAEAQFLPLFRYEGLDFWQMAEPRLHFWWHTLILQMWQTFVAAHDVLRESRPSALVLPHTFVEQSVAVCHAARSLGVPVAIYQHGGFMGNCVDIATDFRELPHADYVFVYGEGTADYFSSRKSPSSQQYAQPIAVGSARIDQVRQQQAMEHRSSRKLSGEASKPVVLYFSSPDKTDRYLNCSSIPPVARYRLQKELFELFALFPHLRFIYKMHPGNSISGELAREKYPEIEVVSGKLTLTRLMWEADLIIVDEPTTGMLESLLTDSKIVVYAEKTIFPLTNLAKKLLAKRAVVAETQADFFTQVRSLLANGDFKSVENADTSFRQAYATHYDDGRSAERALEYLQEL